MYPAEYLRRLRRAADDTGALLVFDEIAVGFGRTGPMFACEHAGVSPDLLCLAKGLTSGALPLSCALATEAIFDAFYDDFASGRGFMHSHSHSGNALACAAAVETLRIFQDEDALARNKPKAARLRARVEEAFADCGHVGEIRSLGFVCVVELVQNPRTRAPFDWRARTGFRIYREALKRGALLRNMGDLIYFMPPYVIEEAEIDRLVRIARDATREVLG